MKKYEWILFDADETLFQFDAFHGLTVMFSKFNVQFNKQDFQEYQTINKALWIKYQNGTITAQQLQHQRFIKWANKLNVLPQELSSAFLAAMAEICTPIEGATSLLNSLKDRTKLGIITNGFTELQQARLERTGLNKHFDLLVISEQVGIAKPHPGIFEHALSIMGNPSREDVLMVGDNIDSDILGGINARIHTCWFNRENKIAPHHIKPHYEITRLIELENLLLKTR